MKYTAFLLFITLGVGCQTDPFAGRDFSNVATSPVFGSAQQTGLVEGTFVKELSGIAPSHRNPGYYWVHNDGKKVTEIYLIDSLGNHMATCHLPLTETKDCEDIEVGTDPQTDISYIYLADTGDNDKVFSTHFIYRILEPKLSPGQPTPADLTAEGLEKWTFQYPNADYFDAETLLFDPATQDLFVLTKANGGATLFRFPHPQSANETTTLERLSNFPIDKATGGDISPDGREVLLKNKKEIYYWKLQPGEKVVDALQNTNPERVPYNPETQGEAICFNLGATGFLTSTERAKTSIQAIFYFPKK